LPRSTGLCTGAAALLLGGIFLALCHRYLYRAPSARKGFTLSIAYLVLLFLAIITLFVTRTKMSVRQASMTGIGWLLAAVAFEFGFGHWIDHLSWDRLLSDYDLSRGRLLLFVWLVVGIAPAMIASLAQRHRRRAPYG
jgi:hypothetical protein